ncbi:MAG: sulfite exporter TauE/SafE family protein [Calothrix sp. SM1_5_4]|nr:sulfite exporter TauE/SafE family protein [Calothrix sp. SM1_5_4]
MIVAGYLASLFMGVSLGLIGGGGSILTVPILFYLFQQDSLSATTNSLFIVGATALVGAILNGRRGDMDLRTGLQFALPSFVGVYVARRFFLPWLPPTLFSILGVTLTKGLLVMMAFAGLMVMASVAMIRSGRKPEAGGASPSPLPGRGPGWVGVGLRGLAVGCTTGFVGAGGGFLIIPSLVLLLKMPMRTAIGTSLAIIAANSFFGFLVSSATGTFIDWNVLLSVSAVGIGGIFVGQAVSPRVREHTLKRGFGYFVLVVGSAILADQILSLFR